MQGTMGCRGVLCTFGRPCRVTYQLSDTLTLSDGCTTPTERTPALALGPVGRPRQLLLALQIWTFHISGRGRCTTKTGGVRRSQPSDKATNLRTMGSYESQRDRTARQSLFATAARVTIYV